MATETAVGMLLRANGSRAARSFTVDANHFAAIDRWAREHGTGYSQALRDMLDRAVSTTVAGCTDLAAERDALQIELEATRSKLRQFKTLLGVSDAG